MKNLTTLLAASLLGIAGYQPLQAVILKTTIEGGNSTLGTDDPNWQLHFATTSNLAQSILTIFSGPTELNTVFIFDDSDSNFEDVSDMLTDGVEQYIMFQQRSSDFSGYGLTAGAAEGFWLFPEWPDSPDDLQGGSLERIELSFDVWAPQEPGVNEIGWTVSFYGERPPEMLSEIPDAGGSLTMTAIGLAALAGFRKLRH